MLDGYNETPSKSANLQTYGLTSALAYGSKKLLRMLARTTATIPMKVAKATAGTALKNRVTPTQQRAGDTTLMPTVSTTAREQSL